jgi:hypothetical protein
MARLGLLLRSPSPSSSFETGVNVFRNSPYANRVRHVAVLKRGTTLLTFFTAIGDAPERVMLSTVDLTRDWTQWIASEPVEVLRPDAAYECANLPDAPSVAGDVKGAVRQLRDPAVFEENGRIYLYYSFCGEQGIAGAEVIVKELR